MHSFSKLNGVKDDPEVDNTRVVAGVGVERLINWEYIMCSCPLWYFLAGERVQHVALHLAGILFAYSVSMPLPRGDRRRFIRERGKREMSAVVQAQTILKEE